MATEGNSSYLVAGYVRSLAPNVNVSESTLAGVLLDAGIDPDVPAAFLTQKQKDLAYAYLLIRLIASPLTSQKVTDKDGDWEHSEGSAQWSLSQIREYARMAQKLLAPYDIKDPRLESFVSKWGVKGTGFRYIRRSK